MWVFARRASLVSFNTASGKYYCNEVINHQEESEMTSSCFNTASGKYYCNGNLILEDCRKSICFNTASGKYYCNSIYESCFTSSFIHVSFNTASGKYYCNLLISVLMKNLYHMVSIPQAVSTIAMKIYLTTVSMKCSLGFNTASGKYYCNLNKKLFAIMI